ncbi:hypothetical protein [Paucibacter sp. KBW04]|uniref:hypothetical protein n=1 Tax=Paucibacter sp. KBW04 TaxID=2153361 RepID=UPI0012DC84A1|nr:hypothetical protein [Paucibacter sp. KBW04]
MSVLSKNEQDKQLYKKPLFIRTAYPFKNRLPSPLALLCAELATAEGISSAIFLPSL